MYKSVYWRDQGAMHTPIGRQLLGTGFSCPPTSNRSRTLIWRQPRWCLGQRKKMVWKRNKRKVIKKSPDDQDDSTFKNANSHYQPVTAAFSNSAENQQQLWDSPVNLKEKKKRWKVLKPRLFYNPMTCQEIYYYFTKGQCTATQILPFDVLYWIIGCS